MKEFYCVNDWAKLQAIYEHARKSGVAFTLSYADTNDEWYFTVESVVSGENWIGKPSTFDVAVADATTWLRRLERTRATK